MEERTDILSFYPNQALTLTMALAKQVEEIRLAHINMVKHYNEVVSAALNFPFAELLRSIQETQAHMARRFQYALNPFALQFEPVANIQEVEIVKENEGVFNMIITFEGIFLFNNQPISIITTGSKHGRFLRMLLTYKNNYVSDKEFLDKIDVTDESKGIGYIRRDLKKNLRRAGIEVGIRRVRKHGHRLLYARKLMN